MKSIDANTISLAEKYAREFFTLKLPLDPTELKRAFRAAAKKLHVDTSGNKSSEKEFIAMKKAYDFLASLAGAEYVYGEEATDSISTTTTDGTPLYKLGLGLGPMKNGRDCERCEHKGYTEEMRPGYEHCDRCTANGQVPFEIRCHACNGSGLFRQTRSQRVVGCRVCRGSGYKIQYRMCPECFGTKRRYTHDLHRCYFKCYECKGTGEIEVFNPAFPKGRLM